MLVTGGGLAGLCAALEAANAGAEVTLLEKLTECGGSSVLSGGLLAFSGTDLQKAAGISDNETLLYDDLRRAGQYQNVEALVRTYVANQMAAYQWLLKLGTKFISVELAAGHSAPRAHSLRSQDFMALMERRAREAGVNIVFDAAAERPLRSSVDGRVEGVTAQLNGKATNIRARRGVVLAAGGFARNAELVNLFVPHQAKCVVYCGAGCSGDGVRMACALARDCAMWSTSKAPLAFIRIQAKRRDATGVSARCVATALCVTVRTKTSAAPGFHRATANSSS